MSVTGLLFPHYQTAVDTIAFPILTGEVAFLLWLLIMGAKELPSREDTFPTGQHAELVPLSREESEPCGREIEVEGKRGRNPAAPHHQKADVIHQADAAVS